MREQVNEYMQIQNTSGNEGCFEETGRQGSKVKADWIKAGMGTLLMQALICIKILFLSDFDFDPTESGEGKLSTPCP